MSENNPVVDPTSTTLPPTDLFPHEAKDSVETPEPPDSGLPPRSLVQEPRWPHPSFGWALLWCLLMVFVTQVPGVLVAVAILVVLAVISPETFHLDLSEPDKIYQSDALNVALAAAQIISEVLIIGFSWLVIRLVAGWDWKRQLALRLPSLTHTLLVLASLPAFALLGDVAYGLMRGSGWVPSISDSNPLNLVFFWTAVFGVFVIALLASWVIAGFGWTRKLASRPARAADFFVASAVLLALVPCIVDAYLWLSWALHLPSLDTVKLGGMEEMGEILGKWPFGLAVLVIGLGPGIGEELWCRGFLGRGLVGSHGVVLGVLASSFCFGLIHIDPCQGTMAMVMGLCLHFVYLCTRSLLLPMLLHFLNNSLNVLAIHVPALRQLDSNPQNIPWSVYATGLLLLGGAAYALYQSRARLAAATPEQILVWRPAFEGVESPPASSGARVVHPSLSPAAAALAGGGFLLFALAFAVWLRGG